MKFGLHLGTRGVAARADGLRRVAQHCERLGLSHFGLSDHVIIPERTASRYPYNDSGTWPASDTGLCLEQITALTWAAAATQRIRLLTSVMVLMHRPPVLAAKMLATLDVLSEGRLTLGVGVGWMAEELAVLGAPRFDRRGSASDEYIHAFRSLWTQDDPAMDGEFVRFAGVRFAPKPASKLPIWVGGEGTAARRRAGRLGDGWYPVGRNPRAMLDTPVLFAEALADVHRHAESAGRSPDDIDAAMFIPWYRLGTELPRPEGGRLPFTGSAGRIAEDVGAFGERGLKHLIIGFESDDLSETLDLIEQFAKEVAGCGADSTG